MHHLSTLHGPIFSQQVLGANRLGQLTLEVETDEVTITTYFKHMDIAVPGNDSQNDLPDRLRKEQRFEARVDNQKLNAFLHSQQLCPNRIVCNINDGQSVHLLLYTDETVIHYFLPAMLSV